MSLSQLFEEIQTLESGVGPDATFREIGEALDLLEGMPSRVEVFLREIRGSLLLRLSNKAGLGLPQAPAVGSGEVRGDTRQFLLFNHEAPPAEQAPEKAPEAPAKARAPRLAPAVIPVPLAPYAGRKTSLRTIPVTEPKEPGARQSAPRAGSGVEAVSLMVATHHPRPLSYAEARESLREKPESFSGLVRNIRNSSVLSCSEDGLLTLTKFGLAWAIKKKLISPDAAPAAEAGKSSSRGMNFKAREGGFHHKILKILSTLHPDGVPLDLLDSELAHDRNDRATIRAAIYQSGLMETDPVSGLIRLTAHGVKWTQSMREVAWAEGEDMKDARALEAAEQICAPPLLPPLPAPLFPPAASLLPSPPPAPLPEPPATLVAPPEGQPAPKHRNPRQGSAHGLLIKALVKAHPNPVSVDDLAAQTGLDTKAVRREMLRSKHATHVGVGSTQVILSKYGVIEAKERGSLPRSAPKARNVTQGILFKSAEK